MTKEEYLREVEKIINRYKEGALTTDETVNKVVSLIVEIVHKADDL